MLEFARLLFLLIHPGTFVLVVLMFSLGTGITDFLGRSIDPVSYWLGLAVSILLLLSSQFLDLFFRTYEPEYANPIQKVIDKKMPDFSLLDFRRLMLQSGITTLTIVTVSTVLLISQEKINLATLILLGIIFIASFFYAIPPIALSRKGIGEVMEAIVIASLIPAFSFLLQAGEVHRLLFMLTVPLTMLMLSMRLALALHDYGKNSSNQPMNMMASMGWKRGMWFHNFLIITAYIIWMLAFAFGLPWRLVWPELLTIPVGIYQIFQIQQIANGMKPNWSILNLTAIALFGLSAYLITLSLWTG